MGRTQQTIWVYVCDVVPCSEQIEIGHHYPGGGPASSFEADSAVRAQGWAVANTTTGAPLRGTLNSRVLCPRHARVAAFT